MIASSLVLACQLLSASNPWPELLEGPVKIGSSQQARAPSSRRSGLSLSLRGGHRASAVGSNAYALLQLNMALPEPIISPVAPQPIAFPPQTESVPPPPPHLEHRLAWLTVRRAGQVVQAALDHHRSAANNKRLRTLALRARYAAGLPDVRLRGGSSADESLRLTPTLDDPARYTQQGARDLWFDAQLTWHLDRALFAPEEVALERLRRSREKDSQELVVRAIAALKIWQKALIDLQEPLRLPEERQRLQLLALGEAALLDALTGGWFSRHAPAVVPVRTE